VALKGWAIPSATDIAVALAVLSLLGERVPSSLKLFLLTLAIVDDMGAILIIALFYTDDLSMGSLGIAALALGVLGIMNWRGVTRHAPYLLVGVVMWTTGSASWSAPCCRRSPAISGCAGGSLRGRLIGL